MISTGMAVLIYGVEQYLWNDGQEVQYKNDEALTRMYMLMKILRSVKG